MQKGDEMDERLPRLPCISGFSTLKRLRVRINSDLLLTAGSLICYSCEYQFSGQQFRDLVDWWIVSSFQENNHRNLNHIVRKECSPINQGNSKLKEVFPPASGRVCFGQCFSSDDAFECQSSPIAEDFSDSEVSQEELEYGNSNKDVFFVVGQWIIPGDDFSGSNDEVMSGDQEDPEKGKVRNPYLHHCTDVLRYLDFTIVYFGNWGFNNETEGT